ncbi:18.9 kDa heat shock protein [Dichanthelium oligosanthes]|uniref:18.9 kDa heat shock protein n=1 Tax=Dichanthelium oligosanthes TaxID=888268 RepID=A0A1E5W1U2_9POAL|nr:18.9 kDa heat shock protein [Dichanthelium oligosanthes]
MSMITSMLGRKQSQQKAGGARTGGAGAGAGTAEAEPVSIDILEPLVDAISLTTFTAPALGLPQFATASMDWKETPTAHVFMADLPGVRRDEVKVEVEEDKVLKISGQRQRAAEDKSDRWHRVERSSERFLRTVRLPPNANTDAVQASLENGVLTITVPKDNDRKAYGRLIPITN